ncbi:hypothetical protein GCM10022270_13570 [Terriglobus aquaticus]
MHPLSGRHAAIAQPTSTRRFTMHHLTHTIAAASDALDKPPQPKKRKLDQVTAPRILSLS